jgi:hypothetical protein
MAVGARGAMMHLIIMADTGAEATVGQGPSANGWQDTGAEGGKVHDFRLCGGVCSHP